MKHIRAAHRIASACTAALLLAMVAPIVPAAAVELPTDYTQQMVYASDGGLQEWFGKAVAVWGDTALVGAPGDESERGAVYVYTRVGPSWRFQQKLTGGDSVAGDRFGNAVAVHGDTAIVGAPRDDGFSGSAYVFTRSGSTWTQRVKLVAPDRDASDTFGCAVAIDGSTALLGAYGDNEGAPDAGAAYFFTGAGATWSTPTKVMASDGEAGAVFGFSVAIDGGTAVIGAVDDDTALGSAYVFTGSGSTWTQRKKLVASTRITYAKFGCSVSIDGGTVLVGSYGDNDMAGAAYVFTGSGSTWTQRKKLVASAREPFAYFGCSVALSGGAALVGAWAYDDDRGRAYLFTGSGSEWAERTWFAASVAYPGWEFGKAVALSGGNALVGAHTANLDDPEAGAAYLHAFSTQFTLGTTRIAGANRYLTAIAASRQGFPAGAPAVVVATGENWPDALGGSALAGAAHGPLLLTRKDALPSEVAAEIKRLGAVKAYVLGSTASVSASVESALVAILGRPYVVRLGGADRYETARLVADETIRLRGVTYHGGAFVATGLNYPDATAASPLAAHMGTPILLANVRAGTVSLPSAVNAAVVLGSDAAVPKSVYDYLVTRLGTGKVMRIGGANRYATAVMVAEAATSGDMKWNGVGLATGENFPDALAAGPMLAAVRKSVLLLTRPTALPGETQVTLYSNRTSIGTMFIFGDTNAVSSTVEAAAKAAAGL